MTYREAIKNSIEKDAGGMIFGKFGFSWFIMSMSSILLYVCNQLAQTDFPTAYIGEDKIGGGKAESASILKIQEILLHVDFLRSTNISTQLIGFFDYLLDCEIPDEEGVCWYESDVVGEHWNNYAKKVSKH